MFFLPFGKRIRTLFSDKCSKMHIGAQKAELCTVSVGNGR